MKCLSLIANYDMCFSYFLRTGITSIFVFLIISNVFAQSNDITPCGSSFYLKQSLANDSLFRMNRNILEKDFERFVESDQSTREIPKIIPVVFHIIHNYGPENISDDQVRDAMRIINEDFKKLNKDITIVSPQFSAITADIGLDFQLARKDPNGRCTNGINRVVSTQTFSADEDVKKLVSWPTNRYMNVWVVSKIAAGFGGYAKFPGEPAGTISDGIVVTNSLLGTIGTSQKTNFAARTLTHEIGHWFNLSHVWGNDEINLDINCSGSGDFVADTPPCKGSINYSCNLNQNTCNSGVNDKIDNVQNYMDYSSCACMFTNGQKNRMLTAINSSISGRNNLWSASNLIFTGLDKPYPGCIPIPDFTVNFNEACTNTGVLLSDKSFNADIDATWKWEWTIPGGTPSFSSIQNPSVSFNAPGSYAVTLKVTNSAGDNSLTRQKYINISSDNPIVKLPVFEGFESNLFPNNGPQESRWRYDGSVGPFIRSTNARTSGLASIKYQNFKQLPGTIASVVSPAMDFSNTSNGVSMVFKVAAARLNAYSNDKLEVFASRDCGRNWFNIFSKSGSELYTIPAGITGTFNPSATEWRTDTIKFSSLFRGRKSVMVKFTVTDGNGNDIFLDDINIIPDQILGMNNESSINDNIRLFPNPSHNDAALFFSSGTQQKVRNISVSDLSGRVLATKEFRQGLNNNDPLRISELSNQIFPPGLYFVLIKSENASSSIKWVIH